jgi:hypothetical protein
LGQKSALAYKVPRQCQFVLLVKAHLRKGKALGSEGGKVLGRRFLINRGKKLNGGFTAHDRNSDINV